MKNTFWAVYDKKGYVVSISTDKDTSKSEALNQSTYRWTWNTFDRDWGYLINDGYKLLKSEIKPIIKK